MADAVVPPASTPPVQAQIIINFHGGNHVTVSFPTNIKLTFFMMGQALMSIGQNCEFKEPSPIVQVPPGTRIS